MQSYMTIFKFKKDYLHSDSTMCIKLKIKFQTGSDQNVTDDVTYLESYGLGEFIALPKLFSTSHNHDNSFLI